MQQPSTIKTVLAAALLGYASIAAAAPEMQVSGRVELDGTFPPFDSFLSDTETGTPEFTRSAIEVSDQQAGVWEYLARVDSSVPKLQVAGSLTNSSGSTLGDIELGALNAFASYTDTITLTPNTSDPYLVTIDMVVDGDLQIDGSSSRAGAGLIITPVGQLQSFDFSNYTTTGIVHDVLTAQYQFSGEAVFDLNSNLQFTISQIDPGVTASGDFSNTAIINLLITTLNGDPLPAGTVEVSSASGFFDTAPVPLPASLPLFLAGLVGVFNVRRKA